MASSGFSWTLPDHPKLPKGKPVAVVVLDGWGEANADQYNCIHVAQTPVMDSLKNGAPERWRLVKAHGTAVGLPSDDDMGNSEVGHNALGAGRIFAQGAKLVDQALASGKIYEGDGFNYIKESFENGTLHLIGLLSDGGVHSRLDQLQLLLKGASERGAKRIRVHILTDGRDVLDGSSVGFVETLENDLSQLREKGIDAQIASGGGRMYVTMDRYENDWDVVKRGWDAQVLGEAPHKFKSALEAVKTLRAEPNANDQYLPPFVIVDDSGKAVGPVLDGDAVVTINFRADRMVMLAKALEYADFDKFDRVRVNLPNGDMVGHTGDIEATVVACKAADEAVKIILDAVEQVGGIYVVTADHGNAEDMVKRNKAGKPALDKSGGIQILTSHTLQPVPVAIGGPGLHPGVKFRNDIQTPGLANVAATVMNLHGFEAPADYETTLIEVADN
ncbi:hypothetical protein PVAP13_5KG594900 [Panicum virgatum]|uniref:phosphoglycerate mutase (2,3-diphosphoglycerate-independent) n=1 Tax=Panicum virgatum TaxID=38727 RepID=A0A8T0SZP4_PANVG|nr:hypothetical protein PVAP13_5KG594900 [Panicum virgatum]KAG2601552.1 hypothetical protein PVAP13_5KG594900 [Panicum virgatum]